MIKGLFVNSYPLIGFKIILCIKLYCDSVIAHGELKGPFLYLAVNRVYLATCYCIVYIILVKGLSFNKLYLTICYYFIFYAFMIKGLSVNSCPTTTSSIKLCIKLFCDSLPVHGEFKGQFLYLAVSRVYRFFLR